MKSVLLVGAVGAGKTTLRQQLHGRQLDPVKTQAMEAFDALIDTPGEYLEVGRFNRALQVASWDVEVVLVLHDATADDCRVPPGFAGGFNREVIGVVTHAARATKRQLRAGVVHLRQAGACPVLCVDSLTGEGFDRLREVLCRES